MPWPLELLVLLGVPAGLGACLARWLGLRWRDDALGCAAWSWLLGTLAVALLLFGALLLRVPVAALRWVPLAALAVAVPLALRTRVAAMPAAPAAGRWPLLLVTAGCLLLAGDRMLRADEQIVCFADEGCIWNIKARALWLGGGFTPDFGTMVATPDPLGVRSVRSHPDYPLLNPLLQLWSFACAGDIALVQSRLVVQLSGLALILLLASAARRVAPPWVAAAAVALVALSADFQEACDFANSDILVALGLLASLDAWSRHREGGGARWLALFAAALASLAWSKNEGLMLALVTAAACLLTAARGHGRIRPAELVALLPAAVVAASQAAFNACFDLHNDLMASLPTGGILSRIASQAPDHLPVIGSFALDYAVLDARADNLLPALVLPALALFPLRLFRRAPAATLVLLFAAAGFVVIYLGTSRPIDWHLRFSLNRVLLQLAPLASLWLAAAFAWLLRPASESRRLA